MSLLTAALRRKIWKCVQNGGFKRGRSLSTTSGRIEDTNVVKSDCSDIVVPDMSITELIMPSMVKYHDKVAVECALTGKKYTFEQLRKTALNFSRALRKNFKLQQGDVVACLLSNSPEFAVITLGVLHGGQVKTTMNPLYTPEEISRQLIDSGAKIMITQSSYYKSVQEATNLTKQQLPILVIKEKASESLPVGAINFEEFATAKIDGVPDAQIKSTDVAVMLFSSGTTGLPKGVELTHSNLVANVCQASHPDMLIHNTPTDDYQDVVPMIIPTYHVYGFSLTVFNVFQGSKSLTLPKFLPATFISMLKSHKVTHLYAAPPLVLFLITSEDVKPEHLSNLKCLMNGAAPLAYSDELRFEEKFQTDVFFRQGYGLTETSPMVSGHPVGTRNSEEIGGSVGKLVPNTSIKVIDPSDPTGKGLGPREQGELLIKGPQVMKGYFNRPEETKNAFLDGWLKTGDMAYYDENKFIFITDRIKELIKVKGYQVPPAELEAVVRTHPAIQDVGIIGIPHSAHGEVPRAYVVIKEGHKLEPGDLQKFVSGKVAKYKQLVGGVRVLDSIPKNPTGKILRRELKERYLEKGV